MVAAGVHAGSEPGQCISLDHLAVEDRGPPEWHSNDLGSLPDSGSTLMLMSRGFCVSSGFNFTLPPVH
jgi:hypothetical protein